MNAELTISLLALIISVITFFITITKIKSIMAKLEDFQKEGEETKGAIGKVAADVARLKAKIAELEDLVINAGMSAEDEEKALEIIKEIKAEATGVDEETPEDENGGE